MTAKKKPGGKGKAAKEPRQSAAPVQELLMESARLLENGNDESALKLLRKAIEASPASELQSSIADIASVILCRAVQKDDAASMAEPLEMLLKWGETAPSALVDAGSTCLKRLNATPAEGLAGALAEAALGTLLLAACLSPSDERPFNLLGSCLARLGEPALAEAFLNRSMEMKPGQFEAKRLLRRLPTTTAIGFEDAKVASYVDECRNFIEPNVKLSVAMITLNEQKYLERCLASLDFADEVILVDTGSTDATVEIAERMGAKVSSVRWEGDFSKARNASLDLTSGEWVMYIDGDEEIAEESKPVILNLLGNPRFEGFLLTIVNFIGGSLNETDAACSNALRMWRNKKEYRFTETIHEQIMGKVMQGGKLLPVDVKVRHYGYLDQTISEQDKVNRNLELVKKAVEQDPDNSFNRFNLGMEYTRADDYDAAVDEYAKALELLGEVKSDFSHLVVFKYVTCLRYAGRHEKAIEAVDEYLPHMPRYTDLVFQRAICQFELKKYHEASEGFELCLKMGEPPPRFFHELGTGTFRSWYYLGEVALHLGDKKSSLQAFLSSLRAEPRFSLGIKRLGQLLLESDKPPAVADFLEKYVDMGSADAVSALADVFLEGGELNLAKKYLATAYQMNPHLRQKDLKTGMIELELGEYRAAIESFGHIDRLDFDHNLGRLFSSLCHILLGELADAKTILATLADGPDSLEARAQTALIQILETGTCDLSDINDDEAEGLSASIWNILMKLVDLREYDIFEKALHLTAALGMPEDLIALNLGKIYFKSGAHDLAGESLLKAVEMGLFDAESLKILGEICFERGLDDEGIGFTTESLKTDGGQRQLYDALITKLSEASRFDELAEVLKIAAENFPDDDYFKYEKEIVEGLRQNPAKD